MFLVSSCNCFCAIYWSHVLSREWRCSWSSADRRCSNCIWVINNFSAYWGMSFIRGLVVRFYPFYSYAALYFPHLYWNITSCLLFLVCIQRFSTTFAMLTFIDTALSFLLFVLRDAAPCFLSFYSVMLHWVLSWLWAETQHFFSLACIQRWCTLFTRARINTMEPR